MKIINFTLLHTILISITFHMLSQILGSDNYNIILLLYCGTLLWQLIPTPIHSLLHTTFLNIGIKFVCVISAITATDSSRLLNSTVVLDLASIHTASSDTTKVKILLHALSTCNGLDALVDSKCLVTRE